MKNEDFTEILAWVHERLYLEIEDMTYITLRCSYTYTNRPFNKCNIENEYKNRTSWHYSFSIETKVLSSWRRITFLAIDRELVYNLINGQTISTMRRHAYNSFICFENHVLPQEVKLSKARKLVIYQLSNKLFHRWILRYNPILLS